MPKIKSALKNKDTQGTAHALSKKQPSLTGKGRDKAAQGSGVSARGPASAAFKGKSKAKQEDAHIATPLPTRASSDKQAKTPRKPQVVDPIATTSTFMIVVGSYEKNLYGIEGAFPPATGAASAARPPPRLRPVFIFPAHISCIKAVAASPGGGKWLATGSDDEIVKIWDLRRRKEVGGLSQHVGA